MEWSDSYKSLAVRTFGNIADSTMDSFKSMKPHILGANMNMLLKTWVCIILLTTILVYVVSLAAVLAVSIFLSFDFVTFLYMVLFLPVMIASFGFVLLYAYPVQKAAGIRKDIEKNMPFALSHMSAISSSGIPPEFMFELLMKFPEYGEISRQAGMIVSNMKTFGMSSVNAIKVVASRTPSPAFRQFLGGIHATIEKGGDLTAYINDMSERSLFDYRIKRENATSTLSTYADGYTALMISAPLIMLVVLGMLSVIGGDVMGMGINDLVFLITWVIVPMANIVFLAFVHATYPEI